MVRSTVPDTSTTSSPPTPTPALLSCCAAVIPVYNHAGRLPGVIRAALGLGLAQVIVVDDGSTDGSDAAARAFEARGVLLLRHETNQGKGAALLRGFDAAAQAGAAYAVTLDGDGQHDPADALCLIAALPSESAAPRPLVLGRRTGMLDDRTTEDVPWTSRFGRGFSNFWVRCSGGPRLSDTQSGFRVYPLAEVLALRTRGRRYQYEVEVLALCHWHGIEVREVPVRVNYQQGARVSHFRPFVDFWRNAWTFTRLITLRLLLPRRRRLRLSSRRTEVARLPTATGP